MIAAMEPLDDQQQAARDWFDPASGEGREFLREATQVKNVWVPYGD